MAVITWISSIQLIHNVKLTDFKQNKYQISCKTDGQVYDSCHTFQKDSLTLKLICLPVR